MRAAYADPPYLGQAKRHYGTEEIDYPALIDVLCTYDAWALSCSSPSLKYILSLCPDNVRIAAWVKPFCIFKPGVNPAYAWEPVVFHTPKKRTRLERTVRDWVSANITLRKGLCGAKPPEFCYWLFNLLGINPKDDTLDDLYPGTGIVSKCWESLK